MKRKSIFECIFNPVTLVACGMLALLAITSLHAQAACVIPVKVKKANAKTFYLPNAATVSKKTQEGLEQLGCSFTKHVMSKTEQIKLETIKYEARIKRIKDK